MYLVLYSFGNFGRGTSIDVLSVFVMTLLVAFPTLIWKYKTKIRDFRHLRTEIAVTTVFLVVWLALCVFLVLACSGACVCLFTDKYGFKVQEEFRISTSWSRQFIGKICPE